MMSCGIRLGDNADGPNGPGAPADEIQRMRDSTLAPPGELKDDEGNAVSMEGREVEYARMIARMRASTLRPPGVLKGADGEPVPIFGVGGADVVGDALVYDAKADPCGYGEDEIYRLRTSTLRPPGELLDARGVAVPIYGGQPLPDPKTQMTIKIVLERFI